MKKFFSNAFTVVIVSLFILLSITAFGVVPGEAASEGQGSTYLAEAADPKVEPVGPAVSQERALQIAREMFPAFFEGKDVNIQLEDNYMVGGSRIWQINLRDPLPGERRTEYFNVGLDAETGMLVSLSSSNPAFGLEESANPITREEARQKAEEYAGKYQPSKFKLTRLTDREYYSYYPPGVMKNTYNFYWERVENGIPVEGDGISVGVDIFSGSLVNFSANWHSDAVFPQPGILPTGLENRVLQNLGLVLCYQVSERVNASLSGVPEAGLYYQLNSPGMLRISPDGGEVFTWIGKSIPIDRYKSFSGLPTPAVGSASADNAVTVSRPTQKISQAEAQKAARDFFKKIGIDQEVVRNGAGRAVGGAFYDETWNYGLKEDNNWQPGQPRREISVGVDVLSGQVKNYHSFNMYGEDGQSSDSARKISRDAARSKAVDFIRLVAPEKLEQVIEEEKYDNYHGQEEVYSFYFTRLVNGIPFLRDGIIMNVSGKGEIAGYNCNWHAVNFPSTEGLITRAEAEKVFLEKMHLKPVYFFPYEGENPRPGKQPALTLMFDSYRDMGIDARTGQLVSVNMAAVQPEEKPETVAPPGHWAAASLAVLADSGLLPAEGFNPDGPVSRRDAIRILMSAVEGDYSYPQLLQDGEKLSFIDVSANDRDYAVIQAAVRRGVLEKGDYFFPEQPLSREDLAVWLVRALGYGDVAGMPVRIELKAADAAEVSEQSYNFVAIAWGLDLVKGDEYGLFRPADQVTWAELASLVTRATPRLRTVR